MDSKIRGKQAAIDAVLGSLEENNIRKAMSKGRLPW